MSPGAKRSEVWYYFKKTQNDVVMCQVSKKDLKYCGNTTNLRLHLKRLHPTLLLFSQRPSTDEEHQDNPEPAASAQHSLQAAPKVRPSTSKESTSEGETTSGPPAKRPRQRQLRLAGVRENTLSDSEKGEIDTYMIKMIAVDYQPLSTVENPGFLEYSKKLNPLYTVPSRKTLFTKLLPQMYNDVKSRVLDMLNEVNSVAITTDMWTSDSHVSYITVTCHFISEDQLNSTVLATRELSHPHTGTNIAASLSAIFEEFKISNKIITVVSDNAANMKNAIHEHLRKFHHPCVAHTLNLSISEAISKNEKLGAVLTKCTNLVGHFKHSHSANAKLRQFQEQMGLPVLNVKQDVATRWNSTLIMIERLVQIKDPFTVSLANLPKAPSNLEAEDWGILSDCIPILKPVEKMTTELSGENYPSISLVIPLVRGLQYALRSKIPGTVTGELLKNTLVDVIARRLDAFESNKIAAKATFLDPRLKKMAFGLGENAANAQKWIAEELTAMAKRVPEEGATPAVPLPDTRDESDSLWTHFDNKVATAKITMTPSTTVTLMLRQYIEMQYLERTKKPLEFWKRHRNNFPELYKLYLKYLCVPATSVPSERVFSKIGQLANVRRNRLSPKNVDKIISLNSYFM